MAIPTCCRGLVRLLGVAVLPWSLAAQAPVGEPDPQAAEFEALLARLTAPLQPDLVRAAVRHPQVAEPEAAQCLIVHLTSQRGAAAVQGLLALATQGPAEVRVAALRGVGSLALRGGEVVAGVRAALRDMNPPVQLAAIAALGAVGEADDVIELLDLLEAEDRPSQAAAFRALRTLTGARLPCDRRSWAYWWQQASKEIGPRLDRAIAQLEAGPAETGAPKVDLAEARTLLCQSAWFDREKVERVVGDWLRSTEPRLRAEGLRVVAGARLAGLGEAVATALHGEDEPEVVQAGVETIAVLGLVDERARAATPGAAPR